LANNILEDREKRYNRIVELLYKYNLPILCGKINYPGNNKNTKEAQIAFLVLKEYIEQEFKDIIIHSEILKGQDGQSIIGVLKTDPLEAKKRAVYIEERNKIGRIFDIDIYDNKGYPIERGSVGRDRRSCIICGKDTIECMRTNRHSKEEILSKINSIIMDNDIS
jgi:holo-ACP synthase CitX